MQTETNWLFWNRKTEMETWRSSSPIPWCLAANDVLGCRPYQVHGENNLELKNCQHVNKYNIIFMDHLQTTGINHVNNWELEENRRKLVARSIKINVTIQQWNINSVNQAFVHLWSAGCRSRAGIRASAAAGMGWWLTCSSASSNLAPTAAYGWGTVLQFKSEASLLGYYVYRLFLSLYKSLKPSTATSSIYSEFLTSDLSSGCFVKWHELIFHRAAHLRLHILQTPYCV